MSGSGGEGIRGREDAFASLEVSPAHPCDVVGMPVQLACAIVGMAMEGPHNEPETEFISVGTK